jgi:glutamate N-acetyltransferase/amino-acid N-acetyltransferase
VSVTAPSGFAAGGIACGIKPSGAPDLAIVATADHASVAAAGVFTSNLVAAAPVQVSRTHLHDGRAAAVVLNSGNANAATGEDGRQHALRMAALTAESLGCVTRDVLVCSTGLIGIPLPMDPLVAGIPKLAAALSADAEGGSGAAEAIRTTDTVRKETLQRAEITQGTTVTIGGMAKGAAMLSPAMATMLAVLTTDAAVDPSTLHTALTRAVTESFNTLIVDDCTSTNDTVFVLANGAAGNEPLSRSSRGYEPFCDALDAACADLARQMAADAEGATKLATLVVRGARSAAEARTAARAVARSQLVQCSLYGKDPYWGRVLSELGASGARFDPERAEIAYQGVTVCRDGIAAAHDEAALDALMQPREITIECDLHAGNGEATVTFTDLTHAYVDENMGTS